MGIKCADLVKRSTTTQIASLPRGERGKPTTKIHGDMLPLPLRNFQWLQQTYGPLMLGLHALTYFTGGHVHPLPPEILLQILVHFGFARVNGVRRFMSFSQDIHLHLRFLRHTKAAPETNQIILINGELPGFTIANPLSSFLQ
jgi:hypothetical protein